MKTRNTLLMVTGLFLVVALGWLFRLATRPVMTPPGTSSALSVTASNSPVKPVISATAVKPSTTTTNPFAFRLANTTHSLDWLQRRDHAILLENAFIDTEVNQGLPLPEHLKHHGPPGAYIVEARQAPDARFRNVLAAAGAQIVSYIPNNAYLVQLDSNGADKLAASTLVQAVLPYEPYYKIQYGLLDAAVHQRPLVSGTYLTLGLFSRYAAQTEASLASLGVQVVGRDQSPFGPLLRVQTSVASDWTALAQLPGVALIESADLRKPANDLARVTLGISADTLTSTNYLNLSGQNVMVEINDSGVDASHPDFSVGGSATSSGSGTRVIGDSPYSLSDTNGHGTHVAGIIAGNGAKSYTLNPSEPQGSVTNADFRGKAPNATLYSVGFIDNLNPFAVSDYYLQATPALTNALISNNSWGYDANVYDLAAASYDAATRDALPLTPGPQPVLFVFAGGNSGGGQDDGQGGTGDTIQSPGTAKNVITVGALEQLRGITNKIITVESNTVEYWQPKTDSSDQVAYYSARGNVGIGTEGSFGRFKPDVVLPGEMVVSCRSGQWDTNAYYNVTNATATYYPDQSVPVNTLNQYFVSVPLNTVGIIITVSPNANTTVFPPDMPLYFQASAQPTATAYDFLTTKDGATIPPDGAGYGYLVNVVGKSFWLAVGNSTNQTVNYDLTVTLLATNNFGNYEQVLEGMNDLLAPYYRYESGTSMAAGAASGMLALLQDFFTNQLQTLPSPALMKALLINGSRMPNNYLYSVTNSPNLAGWGLPNIQNCLPYSPTNSSAVSIALPAPIYFLDQSPTNALATGDSHTYIINLDTNNYADFFALQATLAWTDPPGNPAAAVKLVNNLTLIVTNLDTGEVYYGNDFNGNANFNNPAPTNALPNIDLVNNVQNVDISPFLGSRYSVTVYGKSVNVNAVTANTNNIVQDYALVVSVGEGEVPTAITSVTDNGPVSNPTAGQNLTFITTTNTPLYNQTVGANSPMQPNNTLPIGTNNFYWGSNGAINIGNTNQWHFYVVTNNYQPTDGNTAASVTNAVFLTFLAGTLSVPRIGVFADSDANSTRPSPGLNLFVTTDPGLTNLNPVTLSNCIYNVADNRASLAMDGTEFVYFTDSAPGKVYYVGVQAQDQMAGEYDFLSIFTDTPLSQNNHGNLQANGLLLPSYIPDGDALHPGTTNVIAMALPVVAGLDPNMQVANVIVSNQVWHQNFGDLFGVLQSPHRTTVALNNHDGFGNTYGNLPRAYNDSSVNTNGTYHTDAPGIGLQAYNSQLAMGPWIQFQKDNALSHTGQIQNFSLTIQPHHNFQHPGVIVTVPAGGWFLDYVQVPVGYEMLLLDATNVTQPYGSQAVQLFERYGQEPTLTGYDQEANLTNCLVGTFPSGTLPGNQISTGPPLPMGLYYVGLYNPNTTDQQILLSYVLVPAPAIAYVDTNGPALDIVTDVVNQTSVLLTSTQLIAKASVGVVFKNTPMDNLAITLVNQNTGQRILLMENRGGPNAYGAGGEFIYTNVLNATANGGAAPNTNYFDTGSTAGSVPINYNMYTVPDEMSVYYGTNITASAYVTGTTASGTNGFVSYTGTLIANYPPPGYAGPSSTYLTIVMNQHGNPYALNGDAWTYTVGAEVTNYQYLMFTSDTNLTTVPIAYAIPPFQLNQTATNYVFGNFDTVSNGTYAGPTNLLDAFGGWTVPTNIVTYSTVITNGTLATVTNNLPLTNNTVSVIYDPNVALEPFTNYLALADGYLTRQLPTVPGNIYSVTWWYRGPGIAGWWRGEGNALDSSDPENNANNGSLVGHFTFPAGQVGQSFGMDNPGQIFVFAGTNAYVQIPQPPTTSTTLINGTNALVQTSPLDVGTGTGFTVEGWINPTNGGLRQPVVEWLARVPTNAVITNLVVKAGPYLSPVNGHYYYLLASNTWTQSETFAKQLGGHLATVRNANEQNWIFDQFANYGGYNRNLWIGQTNATTGTNVFGWASGETNYFQNWLTGQPTNSDGLHNYTFILGGTNNPANLWVLGDNNGYYGANTTNRCYGVVEVPALQPAGVQLWVSFTNSVATNAAGASLLTSSNGCLYANLVDSTNGNHEIISPGGLVQTNVFQHIALTYNTNSGIATLFFNGTNVASTNLGVFLPKTTGDVLLGKDLQWKTNNSFFGNLDEISIYNRLLSPAEILAIYQVSALSTNRSVGKFDPNSTPATGLAEALVTINGATNLVYGFNNLWNVASYTFTATTNSTLIQVQGLQPGILLDNFAVESAPQTNLYYLPETSLDALQGDLIAGQWTLEVWDNRTQMVTNSQLVSWTLQFTVQTNPPVSLPAEGFVTNSVPPNSITYFAVNAPVWASSATNTIVSSTLPVNLLFDQTTPPTGTTPPDYQLLGAVTNGSAPLLALPPAPYFIPGQTYYLGVQNTNTRSASVVLTVDFNLITLTNGIPYTTQLNSNNSATAYYAFNVPTNSAAATFQLLKLDGNADLVLSAGAPLPTLTNSAYGSFNPSNAPENIYVLTNSTPVPLTPGTWYLGAIRRDVTSVNYSVLAQTVASNGITVISLTNGVPFSFTAGPGAALTNFFSLAVTDSPPSVHFELYNLPGNGDLTVQTNALPLAPPFLQLSAEPRRTPELIYVTTNSVMTNLAAMWYLGVPNNETTQISYTILAVEDSTPAFPAFPGAEGAGAGAGDAGMGTAGGGTVFHLNNVTNVYHVTSLADDGSTNTLRDAVSQPDRTIVFDVSGTITLTAPLVVTNSFLTLAGQTAPGDGICITGEPFILSTNSDVVLRFLRFREGDGVLGDALQFANVTNVIADHVTVTWSDYNLVSVLNSSNVTVQWSFLADSLFNSAAPTNQAAYVVGRGPISLHHNLLANNYTGSPLVDGNLTLDFVNNLVYNWGLYPGLSVTNATVTNQLNYAANYFIAGLNTSWYGTNSAITNLAFYGGTTNTFIFQTNNLIDSNTNGLLDGGYTGWGMFSNAFTRATHRFSSPLVGTEDAFAAYEDVLDFAGTSMQWRDKADQADARGVVRQTGQFLTPGAVPSLPVLQSGFAWQNTSGDGIPDFWKQTFGWLPLTNSYQTTLTTNANFIGYTVLEEYLAWLAGPHALTVTNHSVAVDLRRLSGGRSDWMTFAVTNAVNGMVYLTNDPVNPWIDPNTGLTNPTVAIFVPTNGYTGYAYFDYYVTNYQNFAATTSATNSQYSAFHGPLTVSVVVSAGATTLQPVTLTNGVPATNLIAPGSVGWYQVNVPANAVFATNGLLSATAPGQSNVGLNLWWSTNVPPTITGLTDAELATNAIAPASSVLGVASSPALIPGGTYYFGLQNTNPFPVLAGVELTFDYLTSSNGIYLRSLPTQLVAAGNTLVVTNTAFDYNLPAVVYSLTTNSPLANALIDANGIITWPTTSADIGSDYVFTTVATDTNTLASATNSFAVIVLPGITNNAPQTNLVAPNSISWLVVTVPSIAEAATNNLVFASLPVNLWWSTNLPPTITNSTDAELLTNQTSGISVLTPQTEPTLNPGGQYLLGVQNTNSVTITNVLLVSFLLPPPPVLPNIPNQVVVAGSTLTVTNVATDTNAVNYTLTTSPAVSGTTISNGIITWNNTAGDAGNSYTFTTVATDTVNGLTATNQFVVTVLTGLVTGPTTNVVAGNAINWLLVQVPTNAVAATNTLLYASSPVNLWWSTNHPPTTTNNGDYELLTNSLVGSKVITTATNSRPHLVAGGTYLLGVQNTNNTPATNVVSVSFELAAPVFYISSVVPTNILGTNGYLVSWSAPTNFQFHLLWSPNLVTWQTFTGVISYFRYVQPGSSQFQFFDDGSRSQGLGTSNRFYRLLLLNSPSNTPPYFVSTTPTNLVVPVGTTMTVTNLAADWDLPLQTLNYVLGFTNYSASTNSVLTNWPAISQISGVITWTPIALQADTTNFITTIVTDSGYPPQSVTNRFSVVVPPNTVPVISSVMVNPSGVQLQWSGSVGESFTVRWTTNLVPPVTWNAFPGTVTSTNGTFTFQDTNTGSAVKFYQLVAP